MTVSDPNGYSATFSYAPDRSRWKQVSTYAGGTDTTIYVGGLLEKLTTPTRTHWKHLIPTPSGQVQVIRRSDGTKDTFYVTTDHLGSTDAVLNAAGTVLMRGSFGLHGARRASNWQGAPSSTEWQAIADTTRRGYTGHEQIDNVMVVHMNGRAFDPVIGRFLSADPYVDGPETTQGWNRYSYVKGKAVSAIDPAGFSAENRGFTIRSWIDGPNLNSGAIDEVIVEASRIHEGPGNYEHPQNTVPTPEISGGGDGNRPPKKKKSNCDDVASAIQNSTGGQSNQNLLEDTVDNYVDVMGIGVNEPLDAAGVNLNLPSPFEPGVNTAISVTAGGMVARTYGGVTPMSAIRQAWNASRDQLRTPGRIGIHTPASLSVTAGATWAINAVLINGMYSSGVLTGSLIRTLVNRAATAGCEE